MPCDGIAVLTTKAAGAISEIELAFQNIPNTVVRRAAIQPDGTRLLELVFDPKYVDIEVKVAVRPNGSIVAITQRGTYEGGVVVLTQMVKAVRAKKIKLDPPKFETHSHDKNAPQLSYGHTHSH